MEILPILAVMIYLVSGVLTWAVARQNGMDKTLGWKYGVIGLFRVLAGPVQK